MTLFDIGSELVVQDIHLAVYFLKAIMPFQRRFVRRSQHELRNPAIVDESPDRLDCSIIEQVPPKHFLVHPSKAMATHGFPHQFTVCCQRTPCYSAPSLVVIHRVGLQNNQALYIIVNEW